MQAQDLQQSHLMKPLPILLLQLVSCTAAQALSIQLDFSFDQANGNFFTSNQPARLALQAAAADLSTALFPALNSLSTDVFTGMSGGTTATLNWSLRFTNPSTGATEVLDTYNLAADQITIYVGMRPLLGSTLGEGGPGAAGISIGGSGSPSNWDAALDNAESQSNAAMTRGRGPVIGQLTGSAPFGSAPGNYTLPFGIAVGNLWFDSDTDNLNGVDNAMRLEDYWHFNHTTPVAAGKNDFYSVALHELTHAIGLGGSQTWNSLIAANGTTWLGSAASALNGGGANLVSGGHIASGKISPRLSDGVFQEVVMDPTLTVGSRKALTQLDLAFLKDLGYATIPEPSTATLLLASLAALSLRRNRK